VLHTKILKLPGNIYFAALDPSMVAKVAVVPNIMPFLFGKIFFMVMVI